MHMLIVLRQATSLQLGDKPMGPYMSLQKGKFADMLVFLACQLIELTFRRRIVYNVFLNTTSSTKPGQENFCLHKIIL